MTASLKWEESGGDNGGILTAMKEGSCLICGVGVSPLFPRMILAGTDAIPLFDGCAGCLDRKLDGVPEARVLLRVVMLVCRGMWGTRGTESA